MMMKTPETNRHITSEYTLEYKLKGDPFSVFLRQTQALKRMEHVLTVAAEQLQHTRSVHDGLKAQVTAAAAWILLIPWRPNLSGSKVDNRFLRFLKSSEGKEPKHF